MSLVNAVHELIEVAAGRRNLSGVAADELHAAIDAEQVQATAPEPEAESPVRPEGTLTVGA